MGTTEIIVVFAALMALIALVSIGIDWIGKPLKHRRFIPRIYRFDDEKVPVDAFGNPVFDQVDPTLAPHGFPVAGFQPVPPPAAPLPAQPAPVVVARVPERASPTTTTPPTATPAPASQPSPASSPSASSTSSAFSDSLIERPPSSAASTIAHAGPTTDEQRIAPDRWIPGLPLDATINDEPPSLAVKAERFWMATRVAAGGNHFDSTNLDRMGSGKAPRRKNPRSGQLESMQLSGLRRATKPDEVHMRWPDDAVDPWSGQ